MNTLSPGYPFYVGPDLDDPASSKSKGPPYGELSQNIEEFIATVKSIADTVTAAFTEKVADVGSVQQVGGERGAHGDKVEAELTIPTTGTASKNSNVVPEIVLEIGAEGGSVTILRERSAGDVWRFQMKTDESTLHDFLSKEDQGMNLVGQTGYVHSLHEALGLLNDKYPEWFCLCPLDVHPEFLDAVLAEIGKRGGSDEVARWREQLKSVASRGPGFLSA
jgi:hypothetical protein